MAEPTRIHVLPAELADQIAAGEVVERPASVVKELVENSLDAGARRVEVEVTGGGTGSIVVVDDGHGMSPEDAHLAVRRYATSKLSRFEDLYGLATMGFRGEALPSIAAVSELTLVSRSAEARPEDGGHHIALVAGVLKEERTVGAPVGTRVEVRRLFAAVPARLKFLKSEATETGHVVDVVTRLALAFPEVHFRLRSAGRTLLDLPPVGSALERARSALGRGRLPVALHAVEAIENGVRVEALLGSPAEAASTSRGTYLLVNRRFVRDRGLLSAVHMGYSGLLERGRYPLAVVQVTVPSRGVDVNVHPQKLEVRFADPPAVFAAVRHTVARGVAATPWLSEAPGAPLAPYSRYAPPAGAREPGGWLREPPPAVRTADVLGLFAPGPRAPGLFDRATTGADGGSSFSDVTGPWSGAGGFFGGLAYLGQLHRTYLLCEAPGELLIIDQHAAHERVTFERLRTSRRGAGVTAQRLLLPATIQLDAARVAVAAEHASLLSSLGLDLEPFGEDAIVVRAVPAVAAGAAPEALVRELLDELLEHAQTRVIDEHLDHALATVACHAATRAGDALDPARVRALLESMDGVDLGTHCPHGRPVLVRVALGELERRFGRV